jgi:hypothetical protein
MRLIIACIIIVLFSARCLCADIRPINNNRGIANQSPGNDSGEIAWRELNALLSQRQAAHPARMLQPDGVVEFAPTPVAHTVQGKQSPVRSVRTDWRAVARESRKFIADHPDSKHVKEARRLELVAGLVPLRHGRGRVDLELETKIKTYLADSATPAVERYEISAMHKDARLELRVGTGMGEITLRRLENARELAAEFPSDPRAWTTMLSTARHISMQTASEVAVEIIKSETVPENIKHKAQRLLDRSIQMKSALDGINLSTVEGKPTLVYFWTREDPQCFDLLRYCETVEGLAFVGVNVDGNESAARAFASQYSLPGEQYYTGPESQAGEFFYSARHVSALLVDQYGVLHDTGSFTELRERLRRMAPESSPPSIGATHPAGKGGS